jgi:hypothetical protein
MWRNAFIATVTVLVGLAIVVLSRLDFLAPYKRVIFARIVPIGIYVGLLAINLFAGFVWLTRKLLLKETGRKLAHLERQMGHISLEE